MKDNHRQTVTGILRDTSEFKTPRVDMRRLNLSLDRINGNTNTNNNTNNSGYGNQVYGNNNNSSNNFNNKIYNNANDGITEDGRFLTSRASARDPQPSTNSYSTAFLGGGEVRNIKSNIVNNKNDIINQTSAQNQSCKLSSDELDAIFSKVRHSRIEEITKLLKNKTLPVNTRDAYGNTLLILGAQNNNKKMVKILIKYGADVNMCNFKGNTALHYTCFFEYNELGMTLRKYGADVGLMNFEDETAFEFKKK